MASVCHFLIRLLVISIFVLQLCQSAGLPIQSQGLYDEGDNVKILNYDNIKGHIYEQSHATIVEFYNSFCGHCRRFAPTWKEIASELSNWSPFLSVAALDCSVDENNDVCRNFEIMSYPTLRFFSPHCKANATDKSIGVAIEDLRKREIEGELTELLINVTSKPEIWPVFDFLKNHDKNTLFNDLPESVQHMYLINGINNVAAQIIMDFYPVHEQAVIRRVKSIHVAEKLNLQNQPGITYFSRTDKEPVWVPVVSGVLVREIIRDSMAEHMKTVHISNVPVFHRTKPMNAYAPEPSISDVISEKQNAEILDHVKKNLGTVYQADLEMALKYALFHEVARFAHITDERLQALKTFLTVLDRYSPLGANGRHFLSDLRAFTYESSNEITGEDYSTKIKELELKHKPMFSSTRWVGCQGSVAGLRGFTCGLWTLFHYLTVQAAEHDISEDPLEVLQAMHGYVKYMFGCTDCSNHFQEMAIKNKIWNVTTKDDAVLWLWSAHNEVNRRLSGDPTEDKMFPKQQFPSEASCNDCRRKETSNYHNVKSGIDWDKTEVLSFLKKVHSLQHLSRFGVDDESTLPASLEALRAKRHLGNVFSDIDMRMGILLYVFCMLMLLVVVKVMLKRRYRRKIYSMDISGKI